MRVLRAAGVLIAAVITVGAGAASDGRLIEAVRKADVKALEELLQKHVDVNAADADGSTALHWAAIGNNFEIADRLLRAGAAVGATTRYGLTPLLLACSNGTAALVERLLAAGADASSASPEGETALMRASLTGRADVVALLIARGAQVNARESWKGQTALMWAAAQGNTDAAGLLIKAGADVNAASTNAFTPFLFAVRNGHLETTKALLVAGAHVNDTAPDGTSALGMAVINAYYELAGFLLDQGANPNAPDPRGSVLHSLAWMRKPGANASAGAGGVPIGPPVPTGNLDSLDLAKALLAHGANPNVRIDWKEQKYNRDFGVVKSPPDIPTGRHYISYVGATPFYVAAQTGDAPLMRVLAQGGADPKLPTVQNITPLMAAAGIGYWDGESPGPVRRLLGERTARRREAGD